MHSQLVYLYVMHLKGAVCVPQNGSSLANPIQVIKWENAGTEKVTIFTVPE